MNEWLPRIIERLPRGLQGPAVILAMLIWLVCALAVFPVLAYVVGVIAQGAR